MINVFSSLKINISVFMNHRINSFEIPFGPTSSRHDEKCHEKQGHNFFFFTLKSFLSNLLKEETQFKIENT